MTTRSRSALWIVTLATLFAAVMRFVRLETLAPAAWFDEVWFALRAREMLQTGDFHVFYPTYFGGANAGLVYLTAIVQALGIDTITSARWVLAASGVIAVPLAYQCFRHLFVGAQHAAPLQNNHVLVGILAAIFLSYTLFDVIITRVGMESGIAPAVAMFVVWQMLIAAKSPSLHSAVRMERGQTFIHRMKVRGEVSWLIAGLALGLAQYNGLHARFILPIAAYLALDLLITSRHRWHTLRGLLILLGAALIVLIPLIVFFAQHPEWFTARAGVVAQAGWDRYADNFMQIARVFSVEGSYDPKTTVPGVPLLDAIQTLGFVIGLLWSILNLHRHRSARVLIVWLGVAMLPGILTDGPNLQRMINIAAPLAGITALGWTLIYVTLQKLLPQRRKDAKDSYFFFAPLRLCGSILCSLIAVSALWNAYLLFVRWPQEPKLGAQFTAPPVDLAREAIAASADQPIFAGHATEAEDIIAWEFLFPNTPVTRLDFRQCLPLPHQRSTPTGYLVLTERDSETIDVLRSLYPQSYFRTRDLDLWQDTASWLEIPAGSAAPAPPHSTAARFDEGIRLLGFDASTDALYAGETLHLTLFWHATAAIPTDYTAFTHIGIEGAPPIAQRDGQPCNGVYPTSRWQAGELIRDSFSISIPADAPSGEYPIAVGWYSFPSLERLSLIDADTPLPDNRAIIGTIRIESP